MEKSAGSIIDPVSRRALYVRKSVLSRGRCFALAAIVPSVTNVSQRVSLIGACPVALREWRDRPSSKRYRDVG